MYTVVVSAKGLGSKDTARGTTHSNFESVLTQIREEYSDALGKNRGLAVLPHFGHPDDGEVAMFLLKDGAILNETTEEWLLIEHLVRKLQKLACDLYGKLS